MTATVMLAATAPAEAIIDIVIRWMTVDDVELAEGLTVVGPFWEFRFDHMFQGSGFRVQAIADASTNASQKEARTAAASAVWRTAWSGPKMKDKPMTAVPAMMSKGAITVSI